MKKPKIAIALATGLPAGISAGAEHRYKLHNYFWDVACFTILILYIVYTILKYSNLSQYTFDERFYDDWDYVRNCKE